MQQFKTIFLQNYKTVDQVKQDVVDEDDLADDDMDVVDSDQEVEDEDPNAKNDDFKGWL